MALTYIALKIILLSFLILNQAVFFDRYFRFQNTKKMQDFRPASCLYYYFSLAAKPKINPAVKARTVGAGWSRLLIGDQPVRIRLGHMTDQQRRHEPIKQWPFLAASAVDIIIIDSATAVR
tara:strand:- start:5812 stop:6174 length:363 start_codon:yes stop_codon:yes gene_type:complete